MRDNLIGALWRVAVFIVTCLFFMFTLFAIFAELRFQRDTPYRAVFSNASGLQPGNFVRIAGVEVGKVTAVDVQRDSTVLVGFNTDDSVVLTGGTRAVIRYNDLVGGRYLAIEEGAGSAKTLPPGGTIPVTNTSPALDLDALIGGFRPLFRALDPNQVNALTSQLIEVFQGEGATIGSIFAQTGQLTSTLADRDQLIGQVITNLDTVMGSVGAQSTQFDRAVVSLSELVQGLADAKKDISDSVDHANHAAATIGDLLAQARPPLQKVVHETGRTASIVVADHAYVDDLLNTLPDAYQVLGRQGLYGDYFSFYLCDLLIKVNGKGGQPVFIKVAGQSTGRCAPR
jgi:phospholipid/cholesterol/gamma-HCH transport system substrate-binding protein